MEITLTDEQKIALEVQHKTERDKYICDRIKAVLLYSEKWSVNRIAQALRIHKDTVRRHLDEYVLNAKLKPLNGGSTSKLNDQQTSELIEHLEENTYYQVAEICEYVEKKYAIKYTISGMTWWLKEHNFTYKKPKKVPAKADEEKQKEFVRYYEELKTTTPVEEPILFTDSVHPTMETRVSNGWIRKGVEKQIATTASRTRVNITGAIDLNSMRVTYGDYKTINAESTIAFLKKLKEVYSSSPKIHIILDCAGYHRSGDVVNYAANNQIELHFLPPYSPNLNAIERLWKVMNENVRNNQFFHSAKDFRDKIFGFFTKTLPDIADSIRSRVNDNFHIVKIATSF